jgi:signal transduction histidine kinase
MRAEKSLLVACLREKRPLDSFSAVPKGSAAILDEQITRFIGKEGILCLPMVAHGENVGVILVGLDQIELSHVLNNMKILTMFTAQAALALRLHHLKQFQLRMIQSERLGASSSLARKVIHEVNNPLSIIKNYLKILGMKLAQQGVAQEEIRIINEEIDRVALILRELHAFSEDKIQKVEPLDINALLLDLVRITKESLMKDSNVQIHTELEASNPWVLGDKNGLKQVFINLITNASEAMSKGGQIHIQSRQLSSQLVTQEAQEGKEYPGYVEITVQDDGPGIPDEIKEQVFEPFIGSKGAGHAGLGLSIVHSIMKALKGTIICESERGKGTRFKIGLPIVNFKQV